MDYLSVVRSFTFDCINNVVVIVFVRIMEIRIIFKMKITYFQQISTLPVGRAAIKFNLRRTLPRSYLNYPPHVAL